MNKFLDKTGLSYFWEKVKGYTDEKVLEIEVNGLPVKVTVLETICENLEIIGTSENRTYTFPTPITLDPDAFYYLSYKLYDSTGTELDDGNSGAMISKGSDYIRWFTSDESNSVTLTATGITDTWRYNDSVTNLTIFKIGIEITNALDLMGLSAEGYQTTASGNNSYAEGYQTTASGNASHAEGKETTASGDRSHAEGTQTTASGTSSHAEGHQTTASGHQSHAEGISTTASGDRSHAEGIRTEASGASSHAEGYETTASGDSSHAEGNGTTASGHYSHAEGLRTEASESYSHAEGYQTTASGNQSHAEGYQTTASGNQSHAEGISTTASGASSHAGGRGTIASYDNMTAIGKYNVDPNPTPEVTTQAEPEPSGNPSDNYLFVVGGGASADSRSNAFRVASGGVYGAAYHSTGADYAEYFEWDDGNPDQEDRAGRFVTLDGEKIRLASPSDPFLLGIVSAMPSVVGDAYEDQWSKMYLTDVFGRPIYETVEYEVEEPVVHLPEENDSFDEEVQEDGSIKLIRKEPIAKSAPEPTKETRTETRRKLNPDYDNAQIYIPRSKRPEWDAVGMLGKMVVVDDGTCEVNGYCAVGENGIGTKAEKVTPYRVMSRLDESHVRILILGSSLGI